MAKNKHLTNEERLQIERLLSERTPLKHIAEKLDNTLRLFHGKSAPVSLSMTNTRRIA